METNRVRRAKTSKVLEELSLSPSPPRRPRRAAGTPRRKPKKEEAEAYWELDEPAFLQSEDRADGQYLLLNWKGIDPATGLKFAPTWEKASQAQIADWDEVKAKGAGAKDTKKRHIADSADFDSDDSEPIRPPTKRIRASPRPNKTRDEVESGASVGTNATKPTSALSVRTVNDTYEDELSEIREKDPELRVEVEIPEGFDPSLYAVAPTSSASQSSQLVEDQRIRARRLRIWDEDIVVPDSLEESGLSSEQANLSGNRGTGSGISSNGTGVGHTQSSARNLHSQSVSESLAEPQSFLAAASYKPTQSSSTQSQFSPGNSQVIVNSTRSGSSSTELPNRQIDEPLPSLRYPVLSQTSLSQHPLNDHGQNFNRPDSASSESQFSGFYTQVPLLSPALQTSLNPNSRRPDNKEASSRQNSPTLNQQKTLSSQDQILGSDPVTASQLEQSPLLSQAPPSTFDSNWTAPQSAQVHKAVSFSASLSASTNSNKGNSQRSAPSQDIAQSIEVSERASQKAASQKSRSSRENASQTKSSQGHRSQSSHLPSPPSEEVLPSIENHSINLPITARRATPPSSDAARESSQFALDPPVMEPVKEEEFDATKALKERMDELRRLFRAHQEQRDRERTLSTMSPFPAVNVAPPVLPEPTLHVPVPTITEDTVISNGIDAQVPRSPSSLNAEHESGTLDVVPNTDERLVALAMVASVRSVYDKALREHKTTLKAFTNGNVDDISEEMLYEVDALFENLRRLCDHQDTFDDASSTQQSSTPLTNVEQTLWAETCSTKCMFLSHLLVRLANANANANQPLHVVVVARPAMIDILRDICQFRNLKHEIAGPTPLSTNSGSFKVTLCPTNIPEISFGPASTIIAFGCDTEYLQALKNRRATLSRPAPFISLVVTNSIEHLDRCFDDNLDPTQKRIRLIKCLRQLGGTMGIMDPAHDDPQHAANLVAQFLENGALTGSWPLPPMPEIDGVRLSPMVNGDEPSTVSANGSNDLHQAVALTGGVKRQNEELLDTATPKRQRVSPNSDMNASHVSDSIVQSSAIQGASAGSTSSRSDKSRRDQVSSLMKKIKTLEEALEEERAAKAKLRKYNNELEGSLKDLKDSIDHIQPRFQEALNDRGLFEHEMKQAKDRETTTIKRVASLNAENAKLKEKNAALSEELSAARQTLATSAVPSIAEMEALRDKNSKLEAEVEKQKKSAAYQENQLAYMRNTYQTASSAAVESASELSELQGTVEELRTRADANTVRIHEIQRDSDVAHHLSTIKRLRLEKGETERECEKRGDEIQKLANKRISARTPVPRSPRIGGAMSPMRNVGRNFRAGSAGGSRGNSPAPGDVFGGNLDGTAVGGPRGGRWGHLQQ